MLQHCSLFSHLHCSGSFKHTGQMTVPHPTHVSLYLLQAQWLHLLILLLIIVTTPCNYHTHSLISCYRSTKFLGPGYGKYPIHPSTIYNWVLNGKYKTLVQFRYIGKVNSVASFYFDILEKDMPSLSRNRVRWRVSSKANKKWFNC